MLSGHVKGKKSLTNFIATARERRMPIIPVRPASKDTLAYLVFSSGTTGLPKGVRISQWNLLACNPCCMQVGEKYLARMKKEGKDFTFRTIAHLPMAHVAGIALYSLNPFYMGGTCYWVEKYGFDSFIVANRISLLLSSFIQGGRCSSG